MIRRLSLESFAGVPHLTGSILMHHHGQALTFSPGRPNVVVGPNGSGKSALLSALAIRFLSYFSAQSTLDPRYVDGGSESSRWWTGRERWRREYAFLAGFNCDTDNAPAVYYRPRHVPGNEASSTHALMMGYHDEARGYQAATEKRSSGEANRACLEAALEVLFGARTPAVGQREWRYGREARDLPAERGWVGESDYKAEVLKTLFRSPGNVPLVLLDEPEQSLDALDEAKLWRQIEQGRRAQAIVATHSLYPLLHRDRFELIETVPGYAEMALELIQ
jgi:predicted ATPase